mmetsp:Transcript_7761/g.7620  ORF Transcript_7761/g.7620 Transcript_7761/m.7620 type:complete len:486 (-) Transcript_7761:143-1600(-)
MTKHRLIHSRNTTVTICRWWMTIILFCGRFSLYDIIFGRAFRVSSSTPSRSLLTTTTTTTTASLTIQYFYLLAGSAEKYPVWSTKTSSRIKLSSNRLSPIRTTPIRLFSSSPSPFSGYSASSDFDTCESSVMTTGYLNAFDAAALDAELMSTPGFSLEQLMELAGLAVAEAVYQGIPAGCSDRRKILFVCGPGNNGGDGLVAARHLYFFRHYDCVIVYPKRSKNPHFLNLVKQCEDINIPILDKMPIDIDSYDGIIDAIFGFSFKGKPRAPFASILCQLIAAQQQQEQQQSDQSDVKKKVVQIISVDVPSGWNVDEGDVAELGFVPNILISLTAPKLCSKQFVGRHFIGGRFLPPKLASKYNIQMPPYEGVSQVMEVTRQHIEGESQNTKTEHSSIDIKSLEKLSSSSYSWREEYSAYLKETHKLLDDADTSVAITEKKTNDDYKIDSSKRLKWQEQYAEYCVEKESRLAVDDDKCREAMRKEHE